MSLCVIEEKGTEPDTERPTGALKHLLINIMKKFMMINDCTV